MSSASKVSSFDWYAMWLIVSAWLFCEAGDSKQSKQILARIRSLSTSAQTLVSLDVEPSGRTLTLQAEQHYLDGRIGLHTAFDMFKTDLFMSGLTESSKLLGFATVENVG
jgi:hypothetical protein